ncbi:prolyl oligopeptidase family serine peptidase [Alicyclobacillus cycloheptanicus]|uniref:Pimeloyl-ACP methyl ester carboxylesterase n=1 Tax=Alicyclobacillus cycloheptanicus TaxID=1457 RepID=A0ABT9XGA4_9BACL|nr:prolyl oligopeptidase family serine peptidase [Alicyclobacillus cycloheptanicus]MDQ0189109.1 pimeloyl-ACP methyl ester carboxylesterase [Alicyclobacillus cycloheptanicus]WDM00239.1 prolyl oligopeptidase family serine peptidase [Alicyclobacillus cycloheptanicus]
MEQTGGWTRVTDLTTRQQGVNPDAEPLVFAAPRIDHEVPGVQWMGRVGRANAIVRLPDANIWNGKLVIGGTPAVRNEYALDWLLADIVLQQGYAFASCDKATPGLTLRDPLRSMAEWEEAYVGLVHHARHLVTQVYGRAADKTYIAGVSNGGYVVRMMLERHPALFDGGVEWEGVLWLPEGRHLLTTLPVYVRDCPIYWNWRGDRTVSEQHAALERLMEAGLVEASSLFWQEYFMTYWVVSLWLYGRSLDPEWKPFALAWTNDWLRDPAELADYPWQERAGVVAQRIRPIANTGRLTKPLLSVAGNWDCLIPFVHHAAAYHDLVQRQGAGALHRMYEIEGGNHVDGLLRGDLRGQQPVQPYFEAALYHLENWVERGMEPPASGRYSTVASFTDRVKELLSVHPCTER